MLKKYLEQTFRVVIIFLLLLPFWVIAQNDQVINFLEAQTPDAWNTQALLAVSEAPSMDHLKSVSGTQATDYAKTILAISASLENPSTFGDIDYVAKLKTYFINDQFGDEVLLNDDFWSILALCSVGLEGSNEVQKARDFIISNQNSDGGWGYALGVGSDTNDTAAAIMALLEAGIDASESEIVNAVEYLQGAQNNDGGFGYSFVSTSDSGSDAWVIIALNKLGIDSDAWDKDGNNPKNHLLSLQDDDGGFWWVSPGTSDYNNKTMTAYAVIALAGKSFPLAYYSASISAKEEGYGIRVEGLDETICDVSVWGETALEVVKNAALLCDFSYNIEDTVYGPYLDQINDEVASGLKGWMFFVNSASAPVGLADYVMEKEDEILLYYGEWGYLPSRIIVDKTNFSSSESVLVRAEYFVDNEWRVLSNALVRGVTEEIKTNVNGEANLDLSDGLYVLWLEKDLYVRSNAVSIVVGSGVGQSVALKVDIESSRVIVDGESMIFTVGSNVLNFGTLKAGEKKTQILKLKNEGTVDLSLEASVIGDEVFSDYLFLAGQSWADYTSIIDGDSEQSLEVLLNIANDYLGSGVKSADLIIWAKSK